MLRLGQNYQRSGNDYDPHVLIQAHGDLSYNFECGFEKQQLANPTHSAFIFYSSVAKTWKQMVCTPIDQPHLLPVPPLWHFTTRKGCL